MDFLHTVNGAQSHFPKDAREECSGQVQYRRTLNVSRRTGQQLYASLSSHEAVGIKIKRSRIGATLITFTVFSNKCPCLSERKVWLM